MGAYDDAEVAARCRGGTAFQQALDEDSAAKAATMARVREQVHAAEAVLAADGTLAASR